MNEDEEYDKFDQAVADLIAEQKSKNPVVGPIDPNKLRDILTLTLSICLEESGKRDLYTQEEADLFMSGVGVVVRSIAEAVMAGKLEL